MNNIVFTSILLLAISVQLPVNSHGDNRSTLHQAAGQGDLVKLEAILKKGSSINLRDGMENTPLHAAVAGNRLEVVMALLKKGADFKLRNSSYQTPMEIACSMGYIEIVKVLAKYGSDINAVNDYNGTSPLILAVQNRQLDMVKYLVGSGADINKQTPFANTPFTSALLTEDRNEKPGSAYMKILVFMIDNGADLNKKICNDDNYCYTPLNRAAQIAPVDVIKLMIKRGAKFSRSGWTLLHSSLSHEPDLEKVKYLLSLKIEINSRSTGDGKGNTPLHLASEKPDISVIKLLLDRGADLNIENDNKMTPYNICMNNPDCSKKEIIGIFNRYRK